MAYKDPEQYKAYQKQYRAETRQWCRENGYCTSCYKNKAQPGYSVCLDCRMQSAERNSRRVVTDAQRAAHKVKIQERRERLIASGICISCGKRPTTQYQKCEYCRARDNKKLAEKRIEKGIIPRCLFGNGAYCARCGKPTENGAKLCPRCLAAMPKGHGNKDNYFAKANALFWKEMNYRKAAKDACK